MITDSCSAVSTDNLGGSLSGGRREYRVPSTASEDSGEASAVA